MKVRFRKEVSWKQYECYESEEIEVPDELARCSDAELLRRLSSELYRCDWEMLGSSENSPTSRVSIVSRRCVPSRLKRRKFEASPIDDSRFETAEGGTVIDRKTGLMWASEDSAVVSEGHCKDWFEAQEFCQSYRQGGFADWRMPTQDELQELYAAFLGSSVRELSYRCWSIGRSPQVDVRQRRRNVPIYINGWVWSSERRDTNGAYLSFFSGESGWYPQSNRNHNYHALPVRNG